MVNKERMSGTYRLSAYYVSKTFSELPLCLVLPSISTIIFYWLAGLNGFHNAWSFFGTWLVMIAITVASQSLGERWLLIFFIFQSGKTFTITPERSCVQTCFRVAGTICMEYFHLRRYNQSEETVKCLFAARYYADVMHVVNPPCLDSITLR